MKNLVFIEYPTTYWSDLLNELHDKLNCEVYFIEPEAKHYNFNLKELESKAHYKFNYLKLIKIFNRQINTGIFHIIRKHQPQYIITREFAFITLVLVLQKNILRKKYKIIVRCDDSYDMVKNKNEFSRLHRLARKILMPGVDNIILVEPRVVEWYKERYQKGILFPIIRKDEDFRLSLDKLINESNKLITIHKLQGKKVIAFVGRFVKLKNINILIKTFLSIDDKDTILLLIGDGEEKKSLETQFNDNRIIYTGSLQGNNLLAYYNCISILALLSDKEAFGAVTNEALLSGAKVLVSERAGSACLVTPQNGKIVDPYNQPLLTKQLKQLISEVQPITFLKTIRPNYMPYSFEQTITNLIESIKKS